MAFDDLGVQRPPLDAIEECFGPDNPSSLDDRVAVSVELSDGGSRPAWVDVAARENLRAVRIPSGGWRAYRSRGASPRQAGGEV